MRPRISTVAGLPTRDDATSTRARTATAPAIAAPTRSASPASPVEAPKTAATLMPDPSTTIATPRPAPDEIPRANGSARGFRKSVCICSPAMPRAAPARSAVSDLGRRMVSTTIAAPSRAADDRRRTSITLATGTCVEPSTSDIRKAAISAAVKPARAMASRSRRPTRRSAPDVSTATGELMSTVTIAGPSPGGNLHVPLELMLRCETRMEDLHQVGEHHVGVRHRAGPVVVSAGRRYPPLVDPHLFRSIRFELAVSRLVLDHRAEVLPSTTVDPDVGVRRAPELCFEVDGHRPLGRVVGPDVSAARIPDQRGNVGSAAGNHEIAASAAP